jgi:hypothetical protein
MVKIRKEHTYEIVPAVWFIEMLKELQRLCGTDFYEREYKDENYWLSGFETVNEKGLKYADVLQAIGYDPGSTKRVMECRWNTTTHYSYCLYSIYNMKDHTRTTVCEFDIVDDYIGIQARLCVS